MTLSDLENAHRPSGWKRRLMLVLGTVGVLAIALTVRSYWGAEEANAEPAEVVATDAAAAPQAPANRATPPAAGNPAPELKVVATVNGEDISRDDLARECLRHYGKEVLESLVNKYLIVIECQRRGITVGQEEVNAEIQRIAKRFGLPVDQWLKMLKQERGIKPAQYAGEIIWPTLALRKLAGQKLQVSAAELQKEYEMYYGPAVKVRLIACQDLQKAQRLQAEAAAKPAEFGNLAKAQSEDSVSASVKGLIQPIRKHAVMPEIEQAAFTLKDGEVSQVIPVAGQFVILQREELIPAVNVPLEKAQPNLEEAIRERKIRAVAGDTFSELQKSAQVRTVFTDPKLAQELPGVAAVINGGQVTMRELGERCIERYGDEVLEGTINRRMLEQACKKQGLTVSDADVDQEIARAASEMLRPKADGTPDVEGWIKLVTEQQRISIDVYRSDVVWPSVALKKLVTGKVQVGEDDLRKGYEANYGPRVRCRAIMLDNVRRAQEVWAKARENPTEEFFGKLAEQYSCEANNRVLKGEVPPIQMHGGQPVLEKEAFNMKPGELSGIVQVAPNRFVILLCLGRTEPQKIEFAQVRDLIMQDVQEKKQRQTMAAHFDAIKENSTVDNYLAGTSHSPKTRGDQAPQPAAETARAGSAVAPQR